MANLVTLITGVTPTMVDLFVTADRRQAQVARGLGLQTELVNGDPLPGGLVTT